MTNDLIGIYIALFCILANIVVLVFGAKALRRVVENHSATLKSLVEAIEIQEKLNQKLLINQHLLISRIEKMEDPDWLDPISNPHRAPKDQFTAAQESPYAGV